jgi:hypothetical protein
MKNNVDNVDCQRSTKKNLITYSNEIKENYFDTCAAHSH